MTASGTGQDLRPRPARAVPQGPVGRLGRHFIEWYEFGVYGYFSTITGR